MQYVNDFFFKDMIKLKKKKIIDIKIIYINF